MSVAVPDPTAAPAPLHVATRTIDSPRLASLGHTSASAGPAVYAHALERMPDQPGARFWLDSARVTPAGEHDEGARHSVLGDAADVLNDEDAGGENDDGPLGPRILRAGHTDPEAAWARLSALVGGREVRGGEGLPLRGGVVGFCSYELGLADLGVRAPTPGPEDPVVPGMLWVRPSRYVVLDHRAGTLTSVTVGLDEARVHEACAAWHERVLAALEVADTAAATDDRLADDRRSPASPDSPAPPGSPASSVHGRWRHDRGEYAELIDRCHRALREGESYELCLTTRFDVADDVEIDPLALFVALREGCPAPYAALLEVDGGAPEQERLAVVSASPERFLSGRSGVYSTKPIKGTAARHADPERDATAARSLAADAKTRAENLMIVDLLRNDLSRVCEPGSVRVPAMMAVESFASVHQLVSTVTGVAADGVSAVDVARALFPGGSMTGAPKARTVELLASWEDAPRGVYSGVLGMFGADGDCELSIVIRTAVLAPTASGLRWSVGAGGAIVADSDAESEHDEVLLKAAALQRAMARARGRGQQLPGATRRR